MNKKKIIVIVLGVVFVVWFLITIFSTYHHLGSGLGSIDPMERYRHDLYHLGFVARDLSILILLGGIWAISLYLYRKKKK